MFLSLLDSFTHFIFHSKEHIYTIQNFDIVIFVAMTVTMTKLPLNPILLLPKHTLEYVIFKEKLPKLRDSYYISYYSHYFHKATYFSFSSYYCPIKSMNSLPLGKMWPFIQLAPAHVQ